ncbi:VOC family protein [Deminuibacter soli]|uniref:Glyoxalase n=1 Tax=Deminuibacter soli TaxID=2291815 RepID=A0A3E1NGV1_9BACT|nr:VOC family protein [Deminuibacter soli]RFM27179.1 glyoxalase [Deminuibacter soli]
MPAIHSILETALYVDDLEVSVQFYQDLFGFKLLFGDSRLKALNIAGRQVLLLFQKKMSLTPTLLPEGIIPPHDGDGPVHMAFGIAAAEEAQWETLLQQKGIAIESRVFFKKGCSIYFRDPDNHLIELATPAIWQFEET